MIALTTKLNERDETIVQLQEEIEAYEKINHQQEDLLEMRLNNINILVTLCKENNIQLPNSVMSVDKNEENVMNNSTNKKGDTKKKMIWTIVIASVVLLLLIAGIITLVWYIKTPSITISSGIVICSVNVISLIPILIAFSKDASLSIYK